MKPPGSWCETPPPPKDWCERPSAAQPWCEQPDSAVTKVLDLLLPPLGGRRKPRR